MVNGRRVLIERCATELWHSNILHHLIGMRQVRTAASTRLIVDGEIFKQLFTEAKVKTHAAGHTTRCMYGEGHTRVIIVA